MTKYNPSLDEPETTPTKIDIEQLADIDTQIESFVEQILGINKLKYPAEFAATTKAIKTLLIQQIDDALACQATPTALSKQADSHCVDCGKSLIRCEECTRLWQT